MTTQSTKLGFTKRTLARAKWQFFHVTRWPYMSYTYVRFNGRYWAEYEYHGHIPVFMAIPYFWALLRDWPTRLWMKREMERRSLERRSTGQSKVEAS